MGEFIAALPKGVICSSPVWLQHAYVGSARSVELAVAALDAHGSGVFVSDHSRLIVRTSRRSHAEVTSTVTRPARG